MAENDEKQTGSPDETLRARAREDAPKPDPPPTETPYAANSRLLRVRKLMAQGLSDLEVRRMIATEFGISRKTVIRDITKVRKQLREEFDPVKFDEHLKDSLSLYRSIYSDPNAPAQARIRAREQADKLLVLHVPRVEVNHTIAADPSLKETVAAIARQKLSDDELELLAKAGEIAARVRQEQDDEGEGD